MPSSPNLFSDLLDRQEYSEIDCIEDAPFSDLWQYKYDGIWGLLKFYHDKYEIYSRTGQLKHSAALVTPQLWHEPTVLLGEFMYGSQWSQHPSRKGKTFVFDCVYFDGNWQLGSPYSNRYARAKSVLEAYSQPEFSLAPVFRRDRLSEFWAHNSTSRFYEGAIFRNWSDSYRTPLVKLKPDVSDDFVVMGFSVGNGRNSDRLGSIEVGAYDGQGNLVQVMSVGGGFSGCDRERIWDCQDLYHGRVIEVSGKSRFDSGALRHPNFVRFRDDKSPLDCKLKRSQ